MSWGIRRMDTAERFEQYLQHLSDGLGHQDRHAGLRGYCTGLMQPLARKSVEPMAAQLDPKRVSARHQSLHHFVAKADWSDSELLARVAQWVVPQMDFRDGGWWIVDDTGFPKKGRHSVGVARQYCGQLGKQDNCQVAVSVSLACMQGSLPVAWQLYLPQDWADDPERRQKAGVPENVPFQTKNEIALAQIRTLLQTGAPRHPVLANSAYGIDHAFRDTLTEMGLEYVVGVTSALVVWPQDVEPFPSAPYRGKGRPPVQPRRTAGCRPVNVRELAMALSDDAWQRLSWREGSNAILSNRFAAVQVRCAGGNKGRARLQPRQWLLIQWSDNEAEPDRFWLSTLPQQTPIEALVSAAHQRWRIERDYQDLKQEFGLGHYEGRGWRGFHHHAVLCIAAYGFLMAERLMAGSAKVLKKILLSGQVPTLPEDFRPRGRLARSASCP